jgi:hypothetical protein
LHSVAVGKPRGNSQGGVKVFAGCVDRGVEVPLVNEEIDSKVVGQCQLSFDRAIIAVLPTSEGFALLIGAAGQSLEMEICERP